MGLMRRYPGAGEPLLPRSPGRVCRRRYADNVHLRCRSREYGARGPWSCRFYGQERGAPSFPGRARRTGGRWARADNDFPDDPDFAELQGVVIENQRYPWESYAAGDSAYRLPVARSLVGGKEDPLLGSDMRRRYVRLLPEVSVELKAGGTRPFDAQVVYLLPDP